MIAIVGSGSGKEDAPYLDPEHTVWGIGRHHKTLPRFDLLFEMHDPSIWSDYLGVQPPVYSAELANTEKPVVMRGKHRLIPNAKPFPFAEVESRYGKDLYVGTVSYMMALAVLMGPDEIGMFGVNCAGHEEYVYQRPNIEWWKGIAEGQGIEVRTTKHSAIGRFGPAYGSREWYLAGGDMDAKNDLRRLATGVT